jgi:hypothetical protein
MSLSEPQRRVLWECAKAGAAGWSELSSLAPLADSIHALLNDRHIECRTVGVPGLVFGRLYRATDKGQVALTRQSSR